VLREYLVSEALHALNIPTTRALAAVATGDLVFRETPLPGAILTRIAKSHIRIGTFEYFAARGDTNSLATLAEHVIERHHPDCAQHQGPDRYLALLEAVCTRQALLIADWMRIGFIHGVMNTDNMSLCGETIDYGPCAFLERYDPGTAFSSIDHAKRYAFNNQPSIAQWNLARFAEALLPAIDSDPDQALALAEAAINRFADLYRARQVDMMRNKLGLSGKAEGDEGLISDFLDWMRDAEADYTNSFSMLGSGHIDPARLTADPRLAAWHVRWQARLRDGSEPLTSGIDRMRASNPVYIARNHQVEAALDAATGPAGDLRPLERLLEVLRQPYEARPGLESYAEAAPDGGRSHQTFCGT
jgi:uncharacterized protein YdiU (UPF0061 family)